jgi:hypothetical protein
MIMYLNDVVILRFLTSLDVIKDANDFLPNSLCKEN